MKNLLFIFIFTSFSFSSVIDINQLLKNSNTVMLIINPNTGKIVEANKAASIFYGKTPSQLKRLNIKDINKFSEEQIENEMENAKKESRSYFIFNHRIANNKIEKVQVFSFPIIYNNQKLLFSIISRYEDKHAIDGFNKKLEQQVKEQTKQLQESKSKIENLFMLSAILLITWIFILIYLLKQKKELALKLQEKNNELRSSNERFELAMDTTKDGLWDWDLKTNKVIFSKTWKEMLGYEEHELGNDINVWETLVHEEDIDKAKEDVHNHIKGFTTNYENIHRMKHKSGHWIWILDRGKVVFDENAKPIRMIGFHTDISFQKEAEIKIQEQKEEFEKIFSNSNDAIAIVDLQTNFLNFNDAYLKLTGYTREELLEKSCIELISKEDFPFAKKALEETIEKGFIENFEKRCIVKDGKVLHTSMNMALMSDKKRLIVATRDVTKQKSYQTKEKLASMGEMIGNIAHQWRQPLSVISTSASGIKLQREMDILDDKLLFDSMDSIVEQAKYLSQTIDDFRAYVKEDKKKEQTSILYLLSKTLSLTEASLKNNYVKVITNFEADLKIEAFQNELLQAFLNIMNNALDAIKQNIPEDGKRVILLETKKSNNSLELAIKDNAGGIEKSILSKIFEPYFTTKHKSIGTGIGLSLSHDILVNHHNAQIDVINEEFEYEEQMYKGAKFIIKFKKP